MAEQPYHLRTKGQCGKWIKSRCLALSTANLYSAVQPGGTLFGLEDTNPVNPEAVYGGDPEKYAPHTTI